MRRWAPVALAFTVASACGDDERIALFRPDVAIDAGADAPLAPPDASDGAPPIAPKRTVSQRNPYGNVAASDNLLWDGDFEWHTAFSEQYGWVNATQIISVSAFEQVKVGADCKSGMKCGYLTQNQKIAAIGVSPGKQNVAGSVWIRVPVADCTSMLVVLISCDYVEDPDVALADADGQPDAQGWCHFEGVSSPRKRSTCMFVQSDFVEGEAIVDDAVLRATSAAPSSARSLSPGERASLDDARVAIRKALAPRPPRRPALEHALERWRGRRP